MDWNGLVKKVCEVFVLIAELKRAGLDREQFDAQKAVPNLDEMLTALRIGDDQGAIDDALN